MPQLAPVTVYGAGDVIKTYNPRTVVQGVATYVSSTGVPVGDAKYTVSLSQTSGGRYNVTARLAIPITQSNVVGDVDNPKVVRTSYADIKLSFDPSSSTAERMDMMAQVGWLLSGKPGNGATNNDLLQTMVHDLAAVY